MTCTVKQIGDIYHARTHLTLADTDKQKLINAYEGIQTS